MYLLGVLTGAGLEGDAVVVELRTVVVAGTELNELVFTGALYGAGDCVGEGLMGIGEEAFVDCLEPPYMTPTTRSLMPTLLHGVSSILLLVIVCSYAGIPIISSLFLLLLRLLLLILIVVVSSSQTASGIFIRQSAFGEFLGEHPPMLRPMEAKAW